MSALPWMPQLAWLPLPPLPRLPRLPPLPRLPRLPRLPPLDALDAECRRPIRCRECCGCPDGANAPHQCALPHARPALGVARRSAPRDSARIPPCAPLSNRSPRPRRHSSAAPVASAARRARPFRRGWRPDEARHSARFRLGRISSGARPVRHRRHRHHDARAVRATDRHHRELVQLGVARSAAGAVEPRAQIGVHARIPQQQPLRGERARGVATRPVQAFLDLQGRSLRRDRARGRQLGHAGARRRARLVRMPQPQPLRRADAAPPLVFHGGGFHGLTPL